MSVGVLKFFLDNHGFFCVAACLVIHLSRRVIECKVYSSIFFVAAKTWPSLDCPQKILSKHILENWNKHLFEQLLIVKLSSGHLSSLKFSVAAIGLHEICPEMLWWIPLLKQRNWRVLSNNGPSSTGCTIKVRSVSVFLFPTKIILPYQWSVVCWWHDLISTFCRWCYSVCWGQVGVRCCNN